MRDPMPLRTARPGFPGLRLSIERYRARRWRRGFSLFGVLLGLGLAAVVIVGAVGTYNAARESANRSAALTLLSQLRANIEAAYAGAPSYGNKADMVAAIDRRGGIPGGARVLVNNKASIRHPFGGAVTVMGGPGGVTNRFRITFADLDDAICAALGDAFAGRSRARAGLIEMVINGSTLASPVTNAQVTAYRVAIPGFAEANRMEADLDMNGHAIEGAGLIEAGRLEVETDLQAGGDLTVAGDLVVGRAVRAAGAVEATGAMTAGSANIRGAATSASMTVAGAVRAATVEAAGLAEAGSIGATGAVAAGSARLGGLDATTVTARTMTADSFSAASVTATRVQAGTSLSADNAGFSRLVVGRCQGCR